MDERKIPKLDKLEAARILENIFEECDEEQNSIPMEELESYSNYKKETFVFQRVVLIVALILFVFLPFMFILPKYTVNYQEEGLRGLPVYSIQVAGSLPIKSITAVENGYRLPVYMEDRRSFTIEPTANGAVEITVTLFNGQYSEKTIQVKSGDGTPPNLDSINTQEDGSILLKISDAESGLDFRTLSITDQAGSEVQAITINEETGSILLPMPETDVVYTVSIADHYGNLLTKEVR